MSQQPHTIDEPSGEVGRESPAGAGQSRRRVLVETLVVFLLVAVGCNALWQLARVVPFVRNNLHAFIAALFLYVPTWLLTRRHEDFASHGLTWRPVRPGLLLFGATSVLVFPLFALGFHYYYRVVCRWAAAGRAVPRVYRLMCRRFAGSWRSARWPAPGAMIQRAAAQLIVVALPEEYFFRGYVQTRLHRVWPARQDRLTTHLGVAVLVTSLLFALGHVTVDFNGLRLAVFFPSLVFGWLRQRTGSILAGVLFHASCNLVSDGLHRAFF